MQHKPTFKEWKKDNIGKSINDYYKQYPPTVSNEVNETLRHEQSNKVIIEKTVVVVEKKSRMVSFLLTLTFGPFGLFYSSMSTAINMILIPIIGVVFGLLLPIICQNALSHNEFFCSLSLVYWAGFFVFFLLYMPICLVLSITKVNKYNTQLIENIRH